MALTNIIAGFVVSTITITVILICRKLFSKQLSAKWQYNLWFFLFIALTLPFIPKQLFHIENQFHFHQSNKSGDASMSTATGNHSISANDMQDFIIPVNHLNLKFLNVGVATVWIAGMVVVALLFLHAALKLRKIQRTTTVLSNKDLLQLFERCKRHLHISKPLIVGESSLVKSPMTFGLLRTYVVLPVHLDERMSMKDIEYIFMHELHHYKYKDIVTNYVMVIFQILYWFHPLVWIAFQKMRLDREIACDIAVLNSLDEQCHAEYGNAIINFAVISSQSKDFALANQFNGPKKQMKKRIEKIASFTTESKWMKLKSITIFTLIGVLVASQIPFISAMATTEDHYNFTSKNTVYEDLSAYFDEFDGSFVLYDMEADQYRIYNEDKSTLRVSPDSTYKIYSALIGLESDVITSDHSTMKWNGKNYPYESWNRDQNLSSAMRHSVSWYFQELSERIPRETIQAYLQQMDYGNKDLSGGSDFWLESSLKISPVEQVQLLVAFYTNQFGFEDSNIQTVKNSLIVEEDDGYRLSGKTGTGNVNGKNSNGWFIGYVEDRDNTYFFATTIQNEDNSLGSKAAEITLSILKDKGIY